MDLCVVNDDNIFSFFFNYICTRLPVWRENASPKYIINIFIYIYNISRQIKLQDK